MDKFSKRRSQAATEYLMTYGWAFLIIAIVAAILISLGVFSPSTSSTVTGFTSFTSASASVSKINGLVLTLTNTNPNTIYLTNVSLSSSSGLKIGKVSVLAKLGSYSSSNPLFLLYYNNSQITNLSISPGQSFTIIISNVSAYSSYSTQATITYFENGIPQSSTGTISGTPVSSSLVPYFATMYFATITITNTQNVATPNPFQQMINISSSSPAWSYINTNQNSAFGQNVEFVYPNGTVIPSWLESYSPTYAIWWIKIGSIPANSKLTIYMRVVNPSTNLFNGVTVGEAPQLSSTYAEYDDGANVFNYYTNFAGTSLPSGWTSYSSDGSVTVNNGVTIKGGTSTTGGENGIAFMVSSGIGSPPYIVDYYGEQTTSPSGDSWGWNMVGLSNNLGSGVGFPSGGGGSALLLDFEAGVNAGLKFDTISGTATDGTLPTPATNTFTGVFTQEITSTTYYTYYNYTQSTGYATSTTLGTTSLPFEIEVGNNEASYAPNGQTIYWFRIRAYPPNGVMPSVSIE